MYESTQRHSRQVSVVAPLAGRTEGAAPAGALDSSAAETAPAQTAA
jgi:hypothetical protein